MPMTPFIGVRISWLMLARNSDLSRTDSSATSRALPSAAATCSRALMSRSIAAFSRRVTWFSEPAMSWNTRSSSAISSCPESGAAMAWPAARLVALSRRCWRRRVMPPLNESVRMLASRIAPAVPATSSQLSRSHDRPRRWRRAALRRRSSLENAPVRRAPASSGRGRSRP